MSAILFRSQCVSGFNSLWPSDTIWRHKSGSTLAQVMACCLTAPSHFLNQCWLITSKVQWHPSQNNFTRDTLAISHWNLLEITYLWFCSNLPGANELGAYLFQFLDFCQGKVGLELLFRCVLLELFIVDGSIFRTKKSSWYAFHKII